MWTKENQDDYNHAYYITHRDEIKAASRIYRLAHPGGTTVATRNWRRDNPTAYAAHNKRTHAASMECRRDCIVEMGGRCGMCGYNDMRALQIDHVNGGGGADRKRWGGSFTKKRHAEIVGRPEDFQVLCANCNWIKALADGVHSGRRPNGVAEAAL